MFGKKKNPAGELSKQFGFGMAGQVVATTSHVRELEQSLGINIPMIIPGNVWATLDELKAICYKEDGEKKELVYPALFFTVLSLENLLCQVMRTSWLRREEIISIKYQIKEIFLELSMNLPSEFGEWSSGNIDVWFETCEIMACSAISCSEKGKMALIMKSTPHAIDITTREAKQSRWSRGNE